MMFVAAALLVLALAGPRHSSAASLAATPTYAAVSHLEDQLRMPKGTAPIARYARWYTTVQVESARALPFSTIEDDLKVPADHPLIVGIFALRGGRTNIQTSGRNPVPPNILPSFERGGCDHVNVVYDPVQDLVLGAWCNDGPSAETLDR